MIAVYCHLIFLQCIDQRSILCFQVFIEGFYKTKTVSTKSSIFDLVTEYDKKIEELLIKDISRNFPTHKYVVSIFLNDFLKRKLETLDTDTIYF